MNTSLNTFLTEYKAELEANNKRFNDLMFRRALNATIDLSCIDRIIQGIADDQPGFNKWCEKMAKRKQDDEDKICCVCYECEADKPLKCSHKLCPTCYDKLTQFPLCREQFKEPVEEYFEYPDGYDVGNDVWLRNMGRHPEDDDEQDAVIEDRRILTDEDIWYVNWLVEIGADTSHISPSVLRRCQMYASDSPDI